MQSVPITAKVVNSNPAHGEVYSIQLNVIKFVSDLRQLGGFLWYIVTTTNAFSFLPGIANKRNKRRIIDKIVGLGLWCLMPLSTIFQL
jgi:hypothetical protein